MGLVATKPVFGVFDQVVPKPACSATETSYEIEISPEESYDILTKVNNKGADQNAQMRRLVCAFVI